MNAGDALIQQLQRNPDRVVLNHSGQAVHAHSLLGDIATMAIALRRRGLQKGDRVVVQVPPGRSFASVTIAVLHLGGVAVFLEPQVSAASFQAAIVCARPDWQVVHRLLFLSARLPVLSGILKLLKFQTPPAIKLANPPVVVPIPGAAAELPPATAMDPEDAAIIVFTGGTTADPKGVRISHRAAMTIFGNLAAAFGDLGFDSYLADTPQQILYGIALGKTVWIEKRKTWQDITKIGALLRSGKVGAYFGSPQVWLAMLAAGGVSFPEALRVVILGGTPITRNFLEKLTGALHPGTRVVQVYGMTEMGLVAMASAEQILGYRGPGLLLGHPIAGARVRLHNADESCGELMIQSSAAFSGYLEQDAHAVDDWFPSGDLGFIGDDGALVLTGREKNMLIRNGINLYPELLESHLLALRDHLGASLLQACAVVGWWDQETQDEKMVLFYRAESKHSARLIERRIRETLGHGAQPDAMVRHEHEFPVVGRLFKVNRAALRELAQRALRDQGTI